MGNIGDGFRRELKRKLQAQVPAIARKKATEYIRKSPALNMTLTRRQIENGLRSTLREGIDKL